MSAGRKWWLPWQRRYVTDAEIVLPPEPAEPELPEGLWERDGKLMFECRGCERAVELECEANEFDPEVAYCGGSPRCLP